MIRTTLEDRVAALEAQMAETRRLAEEARLLASRAHEESGTVGAHARLINGWASRSTPGSTRWTIAWAASIGGWVGWNLGRTALPGTSGRDSLISPA